jgi:dTDP-6-deoxy-L-talose 4-dehydrogenase (NAD+)
MMKVAVTGASGFIGKYVLDELDKYNVEIIGITRKKNLQTYQSKKLHWLNIDLSKPPINLFQEIGSPQVLIHLAWDGLPYFNSLHHFEHESIYQYIFLKKLIEQGLSNIVTTGTCLEYGNKSGCLTEDMNIRPITPYGFAKNQLREKLIFLKKNTQFKFAWCRLFYMYGDGQSVNSIWPQLKLAIENKNSMFMMSGGEQLRDYLHVRDVARYLVQIAFLNVDVGTVNIASGQPISIRALVEKWIIENRWDIKLDLGHFPYPPYEPMAFWGSNEKLRNLLDS